VVRPYRAAAVGIVDPEVTDARHLRVMDADRAGCRERGAAEESAVVAQVVLGNRHRRGGRQEAAVAGRAGLVAGQVPDRSDAADWLLLEHVERRRRRVRSCATLAVQNYDATRAKHFQQSDKKTRRPCAVAQGTTARCHFCTYRIVFRTKFGDVPLELDR